MADISILSVKEDNIDNLDYPKTRKDYPPSIIQFDDSKSETASRHGSPKKVSAPSSKKNHSILENELEELAKRLDTKFGPSDSISKRINLPVLNKESTPINNELGEKVNFLIKENNDLIEKVGQIEKEKQKITSQLEEQGDEVNSTQRKFIGTKQRLKQIQNELEKAYDEKDGLSHQLQRIHHELDTIKSDFDRAVQERGEKEIQLRVAQKQTQQMKTALQEITDKYSQHVKESESILKREEGLLKKIRSLEEQFESGEKEKEAKQTKLLKSAQENAELLKLIGGLKHQIASLEKQEFEHYKLMQELKDQMKENELSKDKTDIERRHLSIENNHLKEKLENAHSKAREQAEKELATLHHQFLQDKKKMVDEMNLMEENRATMQGLMERAIRDKRQAEMECNRLSKVLAEETERLNMNLEEISSKLSLSDRERNEAIRKVEALTLKLHREDNRHEQESQQSLLLSDDLFKRLRRSELELEDTKEEHVKLLSKINELEKASSLKTERLQTAQNKYVLEKKTLEEKYEMEKQQLSQQLQAANTNYEKVIKELQKTSLDQRMMQEKSQEESKLVALKYDASLQHTQKQLDKFRIHSAEVEEQIHSLKKERDSIANQLSSSRVEFTKFQTSYVHLESKYEKLNKKLQEYAVRESEASTEKRRLEKQVDKLNKERTKYIKHKLTGLRATTSTSTQEPHDLEPDFVKKELERVKHRMLAQQDQDSNLFDADPILSDF